MHVGLSVLALETQRARRRSRAPPGQPGPRRARRPSATSVPLARRGSPTAADPRRIDGPLALLDEAERVYDAASQPSVNRSPPARRGSARPTAIWPTPSAGPRPAGLTADDELSYVREFEHITLARILLADPTAALDDACVSSTGSSPRPSRRPGPQPDRGPRPAARSPKRSGAIGQGGRNPLKEALVLAGPEGYVRVFVDEGPHWLPSCGPLQPRAGAGQPRPARARHAAARARLTCGPPAAPSSTS